MSATKPFIFIFLATIMLRLQLASAESGDYISREFGKIYSIRGVSKLMHRMDLSYTKLTYWFAKGKQRIIKTTGKHSGVKLLATLDYAEGKIVWKEDEQYNAESFLAFLESVRVSYLNEAFFSSFSRLLIIQELII